MEPPDDWPWPDYDPAATADERTALQLFLAERRRDLERSCDGLDATQMATRSVEPSSLSLLGLVRHLTAVEHHWIRNVMEGSDAPRPFADPPGADEDIHGALPDPGLVDEAWTAWRAEAAHTDAFVADAPNLEITGVERWRGPMSLRWVLIHLIEEYAQHNGHADLLRERIDGHVRPE